MEKVDAQKFKILSGSVLKLIAVITMTVDHIAVAFAPWLQAVDIPLIDFPVLDHPLTLYWLLRLIGRMSFPIFCFLIGEGLRHTRDQRKYGLRLLIFAILSEIPFDLLYGKWFDLGMQNVYFTLFLGFLMIYAFENIQGNLKKYTVMLAVAAVSVFLKASYELNGVLLVFLLYLLRERPVAQAILAYPLLNIGPAAMVSFVPINLYNGKRGFIKGPVLKFLFYAFYPLHLLILAGIRYLLT